MVGAASCWDVEKAVLFGRPVGKSVLLRPCAGGDLGGKGCCGFGAVRPKRKTFAGGSRLLLPHFGHGEAYRVYFGALKTMKQVSGGQFGPEIGEICAPEGAIDAAGGDAGDVRRGGRECEFSASGASFGAFEVAFWAEFDAEDVGELLLGSERPEMAAFGASDAESGVGR